MLNEYRIRYCIKSISKRIDSKTVKRFMLVIFIIILLVYIWKSGVNQAQGANNNTPQINTNNIQTRVTELNESNQLPDLLGTEILSDRPGEDNEISHSYNNVPKNIIYEDDGELAGINYEISYDETDCDTRVFMNNSQQKLLCLQEFYNNKLREFESMLFMNVMNVLEHEKYVIQLLKLVCSTFYEEGVNYIRGNVDSDGFLLSIKTSEICNEVCYLCENKSELQKKEFRLHTIFNDIRYAVHNYEKHVDIPSIELNNNQYAYPFMPTELKIRILELRVGFNNLKREYMKHKCFKNEKRDYEQFIATFQVNTEAMMNDIINGINEFKDLHKKKVDMEQAIRDITEEVNNPFNKNNDEDIKINELMNQIREINEINLHFIGMGYSHYLPKELRDSIFEFNKIKIVEGINLIDLSEEDKFYSNKQDRIKKISLTRYEYLNNEALNKLIKEENDLCDRLNNKVTVINGMIKQLNKKSHGLFSSLRRIEYDCVEHIDGCASITNNAGVSVQGYFVSRLEELAYDYKAIDSLIHFESRRIYTLNQMDKQINEVKLADYYTKILMYYLFAVRFITDDVESELIRDFTKRKIGEIFQRIDKEFIDSSKNETRYPEYIYFEKLDEQIINTTAYITSHGRIDYKNTINQKIDELKPTTDQTHTKLLGGNIQNIDEDGMNELFTEFVEIFDLTDCDFDFFAEYVCDDWFSSIVKRIKELLSAEYVRVETKVQHVHGISSNPYWYNPAITTLYWGFYKFYNNGSLANQLFNLDHPEDGSYFSINNPYFYSYEENTLFRVVNLLYLCNKTKPNCFVHTSGASKFVLRMKSLNKLKIMNYSKLDGLKQKYNINLRGDCESHTIVLDGVPFPYPLNQLHIPWLDRKYYHYQSRIGRVSSAYYKFNPISTLGKWNMNLCYFYINLDHLYIDSHILVDVVSTLPQKAKINIGFSNQDFKMPSLRWLKKLNQYDINTNFNKMAWSGKHKSYYLNQTFNDCHEYYRNIGRINFTGEAKQYSLFVKLPGWKKYYSSSDPGSRRYKLRYWEKLESDVLQNISEGDILKDTSRNDVRDRLKFALKFRESFILENTNDERHSLHELGPHDISNILLTMIAKFQNPKNK